LRAFWDFWGGWEQHGGLNSNFLYKYYRMFCKNVTSMTICMVTINTVYHMMIKFLHDPNITSNHIR
jgi:hypothetical protein